ncbi:MAG: response regulator [Gammaproteobacteria bacterium]|nr:MAG: response regulator [Gammaproteobacteria bacterium]
MPNISVFYGEFCRADSVVREVFDRTGCRLVTDANILDAAAELSGIERHKLERAFSSTTSVFNKFTHEKERALAFLRLAAAESLAEQNVLVSGYLAHLIPHEITHLLRVCLIAGLQARVAVAAEERGLAEKEAVKTIARLDAERASWVRSLRGVDDPWSPQLYDMVIPMDTSSVHEAAGLIDERARLPELDTTAASRQAVQDFILASRVAVALAREGHGVDVCATNGKVVLTINKHVLMLERLEQELKAIASTVTGVRAVETRVGSAYHQNDVYRRCHFEAPSRVLLVDDEKQFVQTLSERLQLRNMGTAVAYDGESALQLIARDEPEVIVLDLMMPGIDGIEVLKQVKQTRPGVEVIILTGHGSDEDRETCLSLGAFAYLHKPVDIEVLSHTIREANERIQHKRGQGAGPG